MQQRSISMFLMELSECLLGRTILVRLEIEHSADFIGDIIASDFERFQFRWLYTILEFQKHQPKTKVMPQVVRWCSAAYPVPSEHVIPSSKQLSFLRFL